jgi:hypothetical protein
MSEDKKELTPGQLRAISHMMSAPTLGEAAKLAGVNVKTLQRWQHEPHFRAALQTAQGDALSMAVRRMTDATGQAIDVLIDLMANGLKDEVKARVALGVLAALPALKQLGDFEARLAALEMAQDAE